MGGVLLSPTRFTGLLPRWVRIALGGVVVGGVGVWPPQTRAGEGDPPPQAEEPPAAPSPTAPSPTAPSPTAPSPTAPSPVGNAPRDAEVAFGIPRATPAWSALSMDVDGDFADELVVLTHWPTLWMRPGLDGLYAPSPADHPWFGKPGDRHGLTACDVDQDGDLELVVGSGGARGAGGAPAELWERGADGRWANRGAELLGATQGARMRGVSCVDVDGDGGPELWFPAVGEDRADMLFKRQPDGSWQDRAPALGLNALTNSVGGVWGDVNGDGRVDLVRVTDTQAQLLLQGADGVFVAQPQPLGESGVFDVVLFDAENDGDLDLYVARGMFSFDAARDGYFQTSGPGRHVESADFRLPKGCNVVDFRLQGTVDGGPVTLLTGEGPLRVKGRLRLDEPFTHPVEAEQGLVAWMDADKRLLYVEARELKGDLYLGLQCKDSELLPRLVTVDRAGPGLVEVPDLLLLNDGAGGFSPHSSFMGPGTYTQDVLALDIDLDGDLDLFTVGGMIPGSGANAPDQLWENDGQGGFTPSARWVPLEEEPPLEGRLALPVDLNQDAYPDLVIFNGHHDGLLSGQAVTWLNPGGPHRWLEVQVKQGGAVAVGATVQVHANGQPVQARLSNPSPDWRSNGVGVTRFGLGSAPKAKVVVTWPDGHREVRRRVRADQTLVVERP